MKPTEVIARGSKGWTDQRGCVCISRVEKLPGLCRFVSVFRACVSFSFPFHVPREAPCAIRGRGRKSSTSLARERARRETRTHAAGSRKGEEKGYQITMSVWRKRPPLRTETEHAAANRARVRSSTPDC